MKMIIGNAELESRAAKFATRAEAQAAADKAMPRRKHRRPYPVFSGAYDAWVVITGNVILLSDGSMFDHMRQRYIGS